MAVQVTGNRCAAPKHYLDLPQEETTDQGTYADQGPVVEEA